MPIIDRTPVVSVWFGTALTAPGAAPVTAYVRRISLGMGAAPGECELYFPSTPVGIHSWAQGIKVAAFRDTECIFSGVVVDNSEHIGSSTNEVTLSCLDVRHEMAAIQIGQYGIGPIATSGGWPQVGYDLVFNADNKPNRSVNVDSTGKYTFSTKIGAQYWTPRDIVDFMFYWYVSSTICQFLPGTYWDGVLSQRTPELNLSHCDVPTAISRVMACVGGSWAVNFVGVPGGTAAAMIPIVEGIDPYWSHVIHIDSVNSSTTPSEWTTDSLNLRNSVRNSWDRIEVLSAPAAVESALHDGTTNPPLVKVSTGKELPPNCICYYAVDVTKYTANNLGSDLLTGDAPKKWRHSLLTRKNSSGYVAALTDIRTGDDFPCSEAIWLSEDSGATWKRVKSGVHIDFEKMRLYVHRSGQYYGTAVGDMALSWDITSSTGVRILFTVATELELPRLYVATVPSPYLPVRRTVRVIRREFNQHLRYKSYLPDLASTNPNTYTIMAASTLEDYDSPDADLKRIADQLLTMRQTMECNVSLSLPFFPKLTIGDSITFAPLNLVSAGGTMRVTSIEYDCRALEVSITANNNIVGARG